MLDFLRIGQLLLCRHFSRSGAEEEDGNVCISKHVAARLWALREQKQLWSMALLVCSS